MSDGHKNTPLSDWLSPRNTRRSLPMMLLAAREAVMSHFRPTLYAHNVTEQQWRVVRILGESAGPVEAADLANRASVLPPSLTRIIKSLEDRGLITRRRHEQDGRRALLEITPAGLALIRQVTPESTAIYAELETRFGKERIEALLDQLEELVTSLDRNRSGNGDRPDR